MRRDVIAAKSRVLHTTLQDHPIVNWSYRDIGSSNINNESRGFAGRETRMILLADAGQIRTDHVRCKYASSSQIKGRCPPLLHCNIDGLLARFRGIPPAFSHQEGTVREGLLIRLHAFHLLWELAIGDIIQTILKWIPRLRPCQL